MNTTINIRNSTFETNSSSMHTVILTNDTDYWDPVKEISSYFDSLPENIKKALLGGDRKYFPIPKDQLGEDYEFGRGFSIFNDWREKIAYCLSLLTNNDISDFLKVLNYKLPEDIRVDGIAVGLSEYYSDVIKNIGNGFIFNTSLETLSEECGAYVDHQSITNIDNLMKGMKKLKRYKHMTDGELIYEIIFSKRIAIVEDSDETNTLERYILSHVIDPERIDYILQEKYINGRFVASLITVEEYIEGVDGGDY